MVERSSGRSPGIPAITSHYMEHSDSISNFCSWKYEFTEIIWNRTFFYCFFLRRITRSEICYFNTMEQNKIGIRHFIKLHFTAFYCIFYELKFCDNLTSSKFTSTIFATAFDHFVSVPHLIILTIFQLFHYRIYYGDLRSVIKTYWKCSWWLACF